MESTVSRGKFLRCIFEIRGILPLLVACACVAVSLGPSQVLASSFACVAVMPFASAGDASGQGLGHVASQAVASALVQDASLTVLYDDAVAAGTGSAPADPPDTRADVLVVGSLTHIRDSVRLDCRLVRPGAKTVLAAFTAFGLYTVEGVGNAAASLAADIGRALRDLRHGQRVSPESLVVSVVARDPGTGNLRGVMPGDTLPSKARYKVLFTARHDGWVYVYQMDSHGQLAQLYPGTSSHASRNDVTARAGQPVVLPGTDKAFVLDDSRGTEWIIVYWSPQPDSRLEMLQASAQAFGNGTAGILSPKSRDIVLGAATARGLGGIVGDTAVQVPWAKGQHLEGNVKAFGLDALQGAFFLEFRHE